MSPNPKLVEPEPNPNGFASFLSSTYTCYYDLRFQKMPLPFFPASAVVLGPNENVFDPELDKPVLGAAGVAVGLSNCVGVPKPKLNEPGLLGVADVPAVEDPAGVEIPKVELC